MTLQTMSLLAAFFAGCISTEIRSVRRMRRLRGQLGLSQAARMYGTEGAKSVAAAEAAVEDPIFHEEAQQSLRSLQRQLTVEAQASLVPEFAMKSGT